MAISLILQKHYPTPRRMRLRRFAEGGGESVLQPQKGVGGRRVAAAVAPLEPSGAGEPVGRWRWRGRGGRRWQKQWPDSRQRAAAQAARAAGAGKEGGGGGKGGTGQQGGSGGCGGGAGAGDDGFATPSRVNVVLILQNYIAHIKIHKLVAE